MAAKQIIILETHPSEGGETRIASALWFPVAQGAQIPIPSLAASAWTGASAAEIDALKAGTVVEELRDFHFPSSFTPAQVKTEMEAYYASRLSYRNSIPNPMAYYGVYFDGAWSA